MLDRRGFLTGAGSAAVVAGLRPDAGIRAEALSRYAPGASPEAVARDELDRLEAELREAARVQQNFAHRDLPRIRIGDRELAPCPGPLTERLADAYWTLFTA